MRKKHEDFCVAACPSEQTLWMMLTAAVGAAEDAALTEHLRHCPTCETTLARLSDDEQLHEWRRLLTDSSNGTTNRLDLARLMQKRDVPAPIIGSSAVVEEAPLPLIPGYEVLAELGHGGMGTVYKARHVALNRLVALKLLSTAPDAESRRRFQQEAEAIARLQHPHIVQIFDVGEFNSRPYLTLEFVNGASLDKVARGVPLPNREAAQLVETLARAVQFAHQQKIIHRDLKPSNVLMDATGTPKLTDFGLALGVDVDSRLTQSGVVVGTPSYMAPELAAGHKEVGPAVDVYGLGAILYELITGQPPFRAKTSWETVQQVVANDPIKPARLNPRVNRDLETICLKALAKEPHRRYHSALALAEDLRRFIDGEPIQARPESWPHWCWRKVRRRPIASAAALLFLVAIGPISVGLMRLHEAWQLTTVVDGLDEVLRSLHNDDFQEADLNRFMTAHRDVEQRDAARAGVILERFADAVRDRFSRSMDDALFVRLHGAIANLQASDETLGAALQKELGERKHRWEPALELSAPVFTGFDAVFDARKVHRAGHHLERSPAERDEVLLTHVPCGENVELTAVFAARSWQRVHEVRLHLNSSANGGGYAFVLKTTAPAKGASVRNVAQSVDDFATTIETQRTVIVQIVRDGRVLLERELPAHQLPKRDEPLRLTSRREGERLTIRINELPAIAFDDIFSMGGGAAGVFGIYWPVGVQLTGLRATRRILAPKASPLEFGDALYFRGKFAEALLEYRKPTVSTPESRFKEGLCLVRTGEFAEAVQVLAPLAQEMGPRWPHLARCGLWLAYMRQLKLRDADAVLEILQRSTPLEELALLIPADLFQEIWQTLVQKYAGLNSIRFDTSHTGRLEKLVVVCDRLHFQPRDRALMRMSLSFAYRWQNRPADALRIMEDILRREDETRHLQAMYLTPVRETCWLLRELGQSQKALELVNARLAAKRDADLSLLLERARIHAVSKDWSQAEADVNEYFRLVPMEQMHYSTYSSAWLLRGFIHELRGQPHEAVKAWREGLFTNYVARAGQPTVDTDIMAAFEAGMSIMNGIMLGSLSGEFSEKDAVELWSLILPFAHQSPLPFTRTDLPVLPVEVWRSAWQSPRGKEFARQIVLLEAPLVDCIRMAVHVYVLEGVRVLAFRGQLSEEHDQLLTKLITDIFANYFTGKVPEGTVIVHFGALFFAWTNRFGMGRRSWEQVQAGVDPVMRGPLAYILGHRFLVLRGPKTAAYFFQAALTDAAPDSLLQRLARRELERLTKPAPP